MCLCTVWSKIITFTHHGSTRHRSGWELSFSEYPVCKMHTTMGNYGRCPYRTKPMIQTLAEFFCDRNGSCPCPSCLGLLIWCWLPKYLWLGQRILLLSAHNIADQISNCMAKLLFMKMWPALRYVRQPCSHRHHNHRAGPLGQRKIDPHTFRM